MKYTKVMAMLLVACTLQNCEDLASEINGQVKALRKMRSAFTISATIEDYLTFLVSVRGTHGTITVNWGDGTSENFNLNPDGWLVDLEKTYASPGRYLIIVTGDLKNITGFKSSYGQGPFDDINLKPLTALTMLRVSSIPGPEVIDLSHNKKLEDMTLTDMSELREICLPNQHSLWAVSVAGDVKLSASTVDALINSVYSTAIKKGIWGFLHVNKYYYEEGNNEMVGPPSEESIRQLAELQNKYNWEILPVMPGGD